MKTKRKQKSSSKRLGMRWCWNWLVVVQEVQQELLVQVVQVVQVKGPKRAQRLCSPR